MLETLVSYGEINFIRTIDNSNRQNFLGTLCLLVICRGISWDFFTIVKGEMVLDVGNQLEIPN
jgi:hypothetical protein